MQKEASVQDDLKSAFPEFGSKSQLINYYVSFDFPEKQMKMVSWWQRVIEFVIEHENKAYIGFQELTAYLSVYNLKPTPLPAILNYLARKEQLGPENEYEIRQSIEELKKQKQQGWFNKVISFVSKPASKEEVHFKCQGNEKIFSRKIKEFKKQQIKKQLNSVFTQHCKAINQYKLTKLLEERVNLDRESLLELLKELNREEVIKLFDQEQRPFVLYFHNQQEYQNKQWCEIQKMKYCLREEIEKFEFMIDKEEEKVKKLTQKAKEYLESNNKKSSMAVCKEVIDKQKKISTISVRKNVLENQITQLEYNQMNKTTLALLEEAHVIYEQTMIDQSKLEEIVEKNIELEVANRQTNEKLETMVSKDDLEEDVEDMLKELQKEVYSKKPAQIKVHVDVPMEIESGGEGKQSLRRNEKKMEIQEHERNLEFN